MRLESKIPTLGIAISRQRDLSKVVVPMETYSSFAHCFLCIVCGKLRKDEDAVEPYREICRKCANES